MADNPFSKYAKQPDKNDNPFSKYAAPSADTEPELVSADGGKTWVRASTPIYDKVRPFVDTLLPAGASLVGGAIGLASPVPAGMMAGETMGYAAGKQGVRAIDQLMGKQPPRDASQVASDAVSDLGEGALNSIGGQVIGAGLGAAVKGYGKFKDAFSGISSGDINAGKILRGATGDAKDKIINAFNFDKFAPQNNLTTGQFVADTTGGTPALNALIKNMEARQSNTYDTRYNQQKNALRDRLANEAGGDNVAAMRASVDDAIKAARNITTPMRESAFKTADLWKEVDALEKASKGAGEAAAKQVQKVRDLVNAGQKAQAFAEIELIKRGRLISPDVPRSYRGSYDNANFAQMGNNAIGVRATNAAQKSMDFGAQSRVTAHQADELSNSLRDLEISPLKTSDIIAKIRPLFKNDTQLGNKQSEAIYNSLMKAFEEGTDKTTGFITAQGLDSIKKFVPKHALSELSRGNITVMDKATANAVDKAEKVIKSFLGKPYEEYAKTHAAEMTKVNQKELMGSAVKAFDESPASFNALVTRNKVKPVEDATNNLMFDIEKALTPEQLGMLQRTNRVLQASEKANNAATKGMLQYENILKDNTKLGRISQMFSFSGKTVAANAALKALEGRIGKSTMQSLEKAAESPKELTRLLQTLPAVERDTVLKFMHDNYKSLPVRAAVKTGLAYTASDKQSN